MSRSQAIIWSLVAWVGVALFWFIVTRNSHPTRTLAIVVTVSLVTAYASASYINHLILVPSYWRAGRYARYATVLAVTMALLTAAALAVLRSWYIATLGPDPDPYGLYIHYASDLSGMAVHLIIAGSIVRVVGRIFPPPQGDTRKASPHWSPPAAKSGSREA
jgi:Na+-driven multidrug efflux pump